ncbi:MAG: hypothetical protein V3U78_06915 [Thiotrichaceae bacterium]
MSLLLFILTVIGLLTFLFAYLTLVIASFKHHTVTGLISLIPGINLVVLPTILGKTGKAFPVSILGIGIALIAWYAGGHQYFDNYFKPSTSLVEQSVTKINETASDEANSIDAKPHQAPPITHKTKELPLPSKPLYYLVYTKVNISELNKLTDQHIRIKLIDDRELEGKNIKTTETSLLLETYTNDTTQVIQISPKHIKVLEKLEKKS